MYMQGFKCKVTGATSTTPLAEAQPPAMCDTDSSKCVQGAKQMIAWNQLTGNNVITTGSQTPAYNLRNGFKAGAQDDIFAGAPSAPSAPASSSSASIPATSSGSISIPVVPSAPTKVQSLTGTSTSSEPAFTSLPVSTLTAQSTTLSTMVKPSTSSSSVPTPVSPASSTSGSPATVTVTVTATPTHSGHHYQNCWVDGEEIDD